MPKNLLTPNNLRWLTVFLFLLLMVLLLALNLFVQPGVSATNSTPTAQSNSEVNCLQVLHLSCKNVIGTATANAAAAANAAAVATAKANKAATATAKANKTATATAKPTATATATAIATATATAHK